MIESKAPKYIAIVGPTASGKSSLAMKMAKEQNGEIVSCDSVQIYRGFDIGSAKPTLEEQAQVPHHMMDLVTWDQPYDAAMYAREARLKIREIAERGRLPIVVGGTGLYLRTLIGEGIHDLPTDESVRKELTNRSPSTLYAELKTRDPQRARELHPNDHFRIARALEIIYITKRPVSELTQTKSVPEFPPQQITYLNPPKSILDQRILERTKAMIASGLIEEVESLRRNGCPDAAKPMLTIGYKQVVDYLEGRIEERQLIPQIVIATRQYAKRQRTYFGKFTNGIHSSL